MASLRFSLGLIPSTSKIEQQEKELYEEYQKLLSFSESKELARYHELEPLVNAAGFKQKRKEIEGLTYKNSPEYEKEKEYKKLAGSKDIKQYLKTAESTALKRFKELDGSEKIKNFEELEKLINSPEFKKKQKMKPFTFKDTEEYKQFMEYKTLKADRELKLYNNFINSSQYKIWKKVSESEKPNIYNQLKGKPDSEEYKALKKDKELISWLKTSESPAFKNYEKINGSEKLSRFLTLESFVNSPEFAAKKQMKPITFKDTEEFNKLTEYKTLKAAPEIKAYYKFRKSGEYANYLKVENSDRLKRYRELSEVVASDEFKERKRYLLDKKRFEKTDEYSQLSEYEDLKKNPDIEWYLKVKDSDKFEELKKRELTFAEEFDSNSLDKERWLTTYYWGDKLLNDRYAVENDPHIHTDANNFDIRNSVLTIKTKAERAEGKVWSAQGGFSIKTFDFTSGQINTGNSFRQKYGIFSAKIKLDNASARNAFWLLGERITPHIDICRTCKGKICFDIFPVENKISRASIPGKYAKKFYIYTLEWTPDKLVWKVNGEEVYKQTTNIPDEPMYITLAGGAESPTPNAPSNMEIDWIKVYQLKQ